MRFAKNPSFEVTYDHAPNMPYNLDAASNGDNVGCATSAPYPWMGATASSTPPTLTARLSDPDGDITQATFGYSANGGAVSNLVSANTSSGNVASVTLPASFMAGLSTTEPSSIDWHVQATDGEMSTSWSSICVFTYDPVSPDAPTLNSNVFLEVDPQSNTPNPNDPPAGTSGAFSITGNGEAAVRFVYRLDGTPPVTTNSGGDLTCASQTSYPFTVAATDNSNGQPAASITLTAPSPGTHNLYVYACDAAGNASSVAGYEFAVTNDPSTTYSSLASAFDNTAIFADSDPAQANADGSGFSLSATDLTNAGWTPGASITVDGAKLALPNYGAGAADNVLAANQTITTAGQGNALVMLAMAVHGTTLSPDPTTGNPRIRRNRSPTTAARSPRPSCRRTPR